MLARSAAPTDALGGNALTLFIGCVRQADGSNGLQPINTMQYLQLARGSRNHPIINHGRARGLLQRLRHRMLSIQVGGAPSEAHVQRAPALACMHLLHELIA